MERHELHALVVRVQLGAWIDLAEQHVITHGEAGALFALECRRRVIAGQLDAAQWMPDDDGALAAATLID